ncbi:hypothetical protein Tco_0566700 [Tanacetum coccineum]
MTPLFILEWHLKGQGDIMPKLGQVVSNSQSFGSAVLGQMTYLVASLTLGSARSYVMQVWGLEAVTFPSMLLGNPPMKASRSFSVFGWAYAFHQDKASSVRLPVANVTLFSLAHPLRENTDSVCSNQRIRPTAPFIGVVIVVAIIRVVFVVGWAYAFHQDKASSVRVPVANVTLFSLAHLLRENTDSVHSNKRIRPTAPSVPFK